MESTVPLLITKQMMEGKKIEELISYFFPKRENRENLP
jgi:hypothetical protein